MIKITVRPCGDAFEKWKQKVESARSQHIEIWKAGGRPELKEGLWQEFKEIFLKAAFSNKCGYCEGRYCAGHSSHVEHYRPKMAVTENKQATEHCGYFWLAYEWYNLLLACEGCNSGQGKNCEFPVADVRVTEPTEDASTWITLLENECPLLLNPYFDDPEDHIDFDKNGVPLPKNGSERGRVTIEICDLKRESLNAERREIKYKIYRVLFKSLESEKTSKNRLFKASEPFSAWLNAFAARKLEALHKRTKRLE